MKLIGLYIENFGGLQKYSLNFETGITSVIQPNGFGKTTLAEFIRAMFYGFPRKSKTLEKSLRQKYTPWGGGQFGGNLTFEYDGKHYRVERTFGANPKGDTFAVIDLETNRKTNLFPEELGQKLFGLDAESFERSTYLPQMWDGGSLATASIQAKLSDLVEDSSDVAGFDKAMAALKTRRSALIPYRGSGGSVAEAASGITRLQMELDTLQAKEMQLEMIQKQMNSLQQEVNQGNMKLSHISDQLQAVLQQETDILRQQQYTQLQERHRELSEQLRFQEKKYPRGLPHEDALRRAEVAAERIRQCETEMAQKRSVPTQTQLDHCRSLHKQYGLLLEKLCDLRQESEALEQEQIQEPASFTIVLILAMVLGAAGVAAGSVMAIFFTAAYGFWLLGVGALGLTVAAVVLCILKRKNHKQKRVAEEKQKDLRRQIGIAQKTAEKFCQEIGAVFAEFGLYAEPQQYAAALEELDRRSIRGVRQERELSAAREELQQFLFGLGFPLAQNMDGQLQQLRADLRAAQTAKVLIQELEKQLEKMEESDGDLLQEAFPALQNSKQLRREEQMLRQELTAATARLAQLQQKTWQLREDITRIPDVQEQINQAQQRMAEDREKVRILDATMDFLLQARENLATAYMGTIRSRFGYYLSLMGEKEEKYLVDTDFQIQLERLGQARELAYFSAGQTDLVMLCMRLSLADALFGSQEMFVILDDPFVNLDDDHTAEARRLLQKLATGRQILYLSCHSSRAM